MASNSRLHRPPIFMLIALCFVLSLVGCDREQQPQTIEHRAYELDLLAASEEVKAGEPTGRAKPPQHARHLRTRLSVPENAVASLNGRIVRHGKTDENEEPPLIGPVYFELRVDGEELFRRRLQGKRRFKIFDDDVSLADYAGREVELELRVDTSEASEHTSFYWHRAALETLEQVPRLSAEEGRNLLFVVVDTLRADHMSLYGYERTTTPRLEALGEHSLVFEQAFSQSSWTLPSTVTMLTGLAPPRHGAVGGGHHLKAELETLAERLRGHGFTTFAAAANPLITENLGFAQGFETFDHRPWERADVVNASFLEWLDDHQQHRWFAYLHYIDPHDPYDAPPPGDTWTDPSYDGAFTDEKLLNELYHTVNWQLPPPVEVTAADVQYLRDAYDGEIRYFDEQFSELLAALEARGLDERTVIILTSDHGEEFIDHGLWKHGHQLYDESLRVPLLVHAPGLFEPERRQTPVSLQGIFRAALQLMRVGDAPRPGDILPKAARELPVFAHTRVPVAPDKPRERVTVASVRSGEHLLVRQVDADKDWLYDLRDDIEQRREISNDQPEQLARLRALLDTWLLAESSGQTLDAPEHIDEESLEQLRALGYVR